MANKSKVDGVNPPLEDSIYITNPFTTIRPGSHTVRYLMVMLPGNPGLIEFYRPFLSHLFGRLQSHQRPGSTSVEVYGMSMAGFEVDPAVKKHRRNWLRPYGLNEQVIDMERQLINISNRLETQGAKPRIILIGHSVGSYLLLELVRRHRERLARSSTGAPSEVKSEPEIIGGICLFPTVADIGLSTRGKRLTKLANIPIFSYLLGALFSLFSFLIPRSILAGYAARTGQINKENARIASYWLRGGGFLQTLYLGCDEMKQITTDKWDAEVWGAVHPSPTAIPRPRLFFYFGEDDHWVADHTRDDLMRIRGRGESGDDWKPWMEIDRLEIPHAFCLEHNVPVAEKVTEYVETIIKLDKPDGENKTFSLAKNRLSNATTSSTSTT